MDTDIDQKAMNHKKIVSFIILLLGLSLLYAAHSEFKVLSSEYNPLFNVTPNTEIRWLIILGVAASVSGFLGLIRNKIIM